MKNAEKIASGKNFLIIGVIFALTLAYFLIGGAGTAGYNQFAMCITEKGATMYGTDWCGYCTKQKEMFGDAVKHINFVDCQKNQQECKNMKISGYPTWIINGKEYRGMQQLSTLSDATGCGL